MPVSGSVSGYVALDIHVTSLGMLACLPGLEAFMEILFLLGFKH